MNIDSSHSSKNTRNEILQKYHVDHIILPSIHPNPIKSINLTQKIYDLVRIKGNIFKKFKEMSNCLELEERYYFFQYSLEYLYPYNYYPTFIQNYFGELERQAEENTTVLDENSREKIILNDNSLLIDYYNGETEKIEQAGLIIDLIKKELPIISHKLKLVYRNLLQGQDYTFALEHSEIDKHNIDSKIYQIPVSVNINKFLEGVRGILQKECSSEQIEAFIYNSFQFPSNYTSMEILSLDFGISVKTNTLIHKVYLTYKDIVQKKVSRFDFAKVMYLNFEFIRNNWLKYLYTHPEAIREEYIRNIVASNIEK